MYVFSQVNYLQFYYNFTTGFSDAIEPGYVICHSRRLLSCNIRTHWDHPDAWALKYSTPLHTKKPSRLILSNWYNKNSDLQSATKSYHLMRDWNVPWITKILLLERATLPGPDLLRNDNRRSENPLIPLYSLINLNLVHRLIIKSFTNLRFKRI